MIEMLQTLGYGAHFTRLDVDGMQAELHSGIVERAAHHRFTIIGDGGAVACGSAIDERFVGIVGEINHAQSGIIFATNEDLMATRHK